MKRIQTQSAIVRVNVTVIAGVAGAIVGLILFLGGLHSARYPKLNVVFRANGSAEPGVASEPRPEVTRSKASIGFGIGRMVLGAGLCLYVLRQAWNSRRRSSSSGQAGNPVASDEPTQRGTS